MGFALVTGGTAGIGAEFARQLAAKGFDLVLVARSASRLEEVAHELRGMGRVVEVLPADLSLRADVDRVADRLRDDSRPIELLVNNAGFGIHSKIADGDTARMDEALEVMVRAVLVLASAAADGMRRRGRGRIVNVSSTAAFVTLGMYSAIKSWVLSFSEGLSNELRGTGVTVTALCPGWVHTEFHDRAGIRKSSIPDALWLDVQPLVRSAIRDAERGKVVSIPSARYAFLMGLLRHLPRSTVRWVSRAISSSRRDTVAT